MSEQIKVYGFCENKCRREVMLKSEVEERFDKIPSINAEQLAGITVQVKANTAKIDILKNLGIGGIHRDFVIRSNLKVGEETTVFTFDSETFDDNLEEYAYYMWYLRNTAHGRDMMFSNIKDSGITNFENLSGSVEVRFKNMWGTDLAYQKCPLIVASDGYFYFDFDVFLMGIGQYIEKYSSGYVNGFTGCYITMQPYLYEKTEGSESDGIKYWNNTPVSAEFSFGSHFEFVARKTGYDMSKLPNGGELPEVSGTRNYNELENKPSINGVTLKGDLTTEQLGLGGSGDSGEHTHEGYVSVDTYNALLERVVQLEAKVNSMPTITFSDTEPIEVAENNIVMVYEAAESE